ncbi:MAG: serine/threonine-protein kinase [Thermoanaerobaculia bacterium]
MTSGTADPAGSGTIPRAPEETPTMVVHEAPPGATEFTPGTLLGDRYRIVSRLGKGGMGEVYRADDLRLGLPVALKFVLPRLASQQEHVLREVRVGRDISHPHVCRIHDIGEIGGRFFISMEYIDGEDLASLLRRIGSLPPGKALMVTRQIASGVAAAHDRGIIHRDLKPANVMIDGRGNARITDFGLAHSEIEGRSGTVSGTPVYMAPEQFTEARATMAADVYALGLVFYELWTGRRLIAGTSISEILESHRPEVVRRALRTTPVPDAGIAALIDSCLDEDPSRRPQSAAAVLARLPGGDVLDAALSSGQTPSPEMLAAAAGTGELTRVTAWSCFLATAALLVAFAALSDRTMLHGLVDLPLNRTQLHARGEQIVRATGWTDADLRPRDRASWFMRNDRFLRWRERQAGGSRLSLQRGILFTYRQSPEPMVTFSGRLTESDPALATSGMARAVIDSRGRLHTLAVVPPIRLTASRGPMAPPAWQRFIQLAGLEHAGLRRVSPVLTAPVDSDARAAWEGRDPLDGTPVRVEAAALSGRVVWFEVMQPWRMGAAGAVPRRAGDFAADLVMIAISLGSMIAMFLLARRNLRRGQGDRKGTWRVALAVFVLAALSVMLRAHHPGELMAEVDIANVAAMKSVYFSLIIASGYLAIEPLVRRRWPRTLVSWSRILEGRILDPMVGRDVLIGLLAGGATVMATYALPPILGTDGSPWEIGTASLGTPRLVLFYFVFNAFEAVGRAGGVLLLLVLFRGLLRSQRAALVIVFALIAVTSLPLTAGPMPVRIATCFIGALVPVLLILPFGMVSVASFAWVVLMITRVPLTLDPSSWHFGASLAVLGVMIGVAAVAFQRSLGGKPLFAAPVFEE